MRTETEHPCMMIHKDKHITYSTKVAKCRYTHTHTHTRTHTHTHTLADIDIS